MDRKRIEYFVCLIKYGSYTEASKRLFITQPSLSIAIRNLEKSCGVKLVENINGVIKPTAAGRLLYDEGKQILDSFDSLDIELNKLKNSYEYEITISSIESTNNWLMEKLKNTNSFEDSKVKIVELVKEEEIISALEFKKIHFALSNSYINTKYIKSQQVFEDNLALVCNKNTGIDNLNENNIEMLNGHPFILSSKGLDSRREILQFLAYYNLNPYTGFEVERYETILKIIENNMGISILPIQYLKTNINEKIQVIPIQLDHFKRKVYINYLESRQNEKIFSKLL